MAYEDKCEDQNHIHEKRTVYHCPYHGEVAFSWGLQCSNCALVNGINGTPPGPIVTERTKYTCHQTFRVWYE